MSNLTTFLRGANKVTYANGTSSLTAVTVQAAIDELDVSVDGLLTDVSDLRTLTGTADGDTSLGTFTGATVPDNSTIKAAFQSLETSVEGKVSKTGDTMTGALTLPANVGGAPSLKFTGADANTGLLFNSNNVFLQNIDGNIELQATTSLNFNAITGNAILNSGNNLTLNTTGGNVLIKTDDASGKITLAANTGANNGNIILNSVALELNHTDSINIESSGQIRNFFDSSILFEHTNGNVLTITENDVTTQIPIISLVEATAANHLTTKAYVDSVAAGLDPKASVKGTTTTDVGGTYNAAGGTGGSGNITGVDLTSDAIFDGVPSSSAYAAGDRILVKNQASATQNGLYVVVTAGASGVIERASDHDGTPANEVSGGNHTFVETGSTFALSGFVLQGNGNLALNTDNIVWTQFSGAGAVNAGNGLGQTGNTLFVNVDDATIEIISDTLQVKADGINDTHINFGTGANQVSAADLPIADAGSIIGATDVEGALQENRTAIDAIEDNTITSPNGSISFAGTVGADDQTGDVVFSTTGEANRSIEASALAATTGSALVGYDNASSGLTATTAQAAIDEVEGRIETLEGATGVDWTLVTANTNAVDGSRLLVDTTSNVVTVTLPASPSTGDSVIIRDAKRNTETNAITVARNGQDIENLAEDFVIDVNGATVNLVYIDAAFGWSVGLI